MSRTGWRYHGPRLHGFRTNLHVAFGFSLVFFLSLLSSLYRLLPEADDRSAVRVDSFMRGIQHPAVVRMKNRRPHANRTEQKRIEPNRISSRSCLFRQNIGPRVMSCRAPVVAGRCFDNEIRKSRRQNFGTRRSRLR